MRAVPTTPFGCLYSGTLAAMLGLAASCQASFAQSVDSRFLTQLVLPAHVGNQVFYSRSRDWYVKCDIEADPETRRCELSTMDIMEGEAPKLGFGLTVIKTGRAAPPVAILRTPLNLHLSSGVAMEVDQRSIGKLTYRSCDQNGCTVAYSLEGQIGTRMAKGTGVSFEFRDLAGKAHIARFSLIGITNALRMANDFF